MFSRFRLSFLILLMSALPAAASVLASMSLDMTNPKVILPLIIFFEMPAAIYVSGFMTKEDRTTLKERFSGLLFQNFQDMSFGQILFELFLGENSITMISIRIWIAFVGCLTSTYCFAWAAPDIAGFFQLPLLSVTTISLTIFSYVFIRNLCESRLRDQIGHAALCIIWAGGVFGLIKLLIDQTVFGPGIAG
jgi:hypothetical protein